MAGKKKLITREVVVTVRFTKQEIERILNASTTKNTAEAVRTFALKCAEQAEQEVRETALLLSKLENADITKIATKIDILLQKVDKQNNAEVLQKLDTLLNTKSDNQAEILQNISAFLNRIDKSIAAIATAKPDTSNSKQIESLLRQIIAYVTSTNTMLENLIKK